LNDFIENLLDSFYPRLKEGVLNEIVMYVTERDITDEQFSKALSSFRLNDDEGDYSPTLRRLIPHFEKITHVFSDDHRLNPNIFLGFWSMAEFYGFSYAVRKAMESGCGLGGKESSALRSFFIAHGITPEHKLFEVERLLLGEDNLWYADYLRKLQDQQDPS